MISISARRKSWRNSGGLVQKASEDLVLVFKTFLICFSERALVPSILTEPTRGKPVPAPPWLQDASGRAAPKEWTSTATRAARRNRDLARALGLGLAALLGSRRSVTLRFTPKVVE